MFIEKLEIVLKEKNITKNKLAKAIDYSQSATSQWKKGRVPQIDVLQKICQYLHVSADYLLDLTDETPPPELTQEEQDLINDFRECDSGTRKSIQLLASSGAAEAKAQETLLNSEIAG